MKIVITGGHFSPAYALIQKIKNENDLLVIGRRFAFDGDLGETYEYKICKKQNIPFEELKTGRLSRKINITSFVNFSKFPKGIYQAIKILKEFKPDVIVTFGGYVGLPTAIAGKILNIPVILHEQTQKAGISSKLISKFANEILISFPSSIDHFKGKKTILTGNLLRPEFYEEHNSFNIKNPAIYITGGSTGSHFINQTIEKILPQLLSRYEVYHQTGNSQEFKDFEKLSKIVNKNYHVQEFFTPENVYELFKKVDLVVSRSGINTVCEIVASNAVSLLIPLPHGQKNEQFDNAILIKNLKIGEYIDQESLEQQNLLEKIDEIIKNKEIYKKNFKNENSFLVDKSCEKIIKEIYFYGKREDSPKTLVD